MIRGTNPSRPPTPRCSRRSGVDVCFSVDITKHNRSQAPTTTTTATTTTTTTTTATTTTTTTTTTATTTTTTKIGRGCLFQCSGPETVVSSYALTCALPSLV